MSNLIEQIDFSVYMSGKTTAWNQTTVLSNYAWYSYYINGISFKTNFGSVKIDVRINGASCISGLSNIIGTTTTNTYYPNYGNLVNIGDMVDIKYISESGNASEIYGSMKIQRPPHYIGEEYGGGIIFYLTSGCTQGLIAMKNDGPKAEWGCVTKLLQGANGVTIGTGKKNTLDICSGCTELNIAARYCNDLVWEGYNDWFLPSKAELQEMYKYRNLIGNFGNDVAYWSSTQFNNNDAVDQYFIDSYGISNHWKNWTQRVRAIREF